MIRYLSLAELIIVAEEALNGPPVIRDEGLLDAAVHRPRASFSGQDAYPSVLDKAAALMHSLVSSHPLLDGNKRLGWAATAVFLQVNEVKLRHSTPEAVKLVIKVASGELTEVSDIAARLNSFI